MELEKEIARGGQQDRKQLIEESFMHANSRKPVSLNVVSSDRVPSSFYIYIYIYPHLACIMVSS